MLEQFFKNQLTSLLGGKGGGGIQSGGCMQCTTDYLIFFTVALVFLLVRAYILQLTFNYIIPRLSRFSETNIADPNQMSYRELTYGEALVLLIFANTLFGR